MRIYVTGDTHRTHNIDKISKLNFPEQKELTKEDYLIVAGDFGMFWNNSKDELFWRNVLKEKNFTTLFIDGNHENFDILEQYEVSEWCGGKVRIIDGIIHLMRGQVYNIGGYKLFTMGGAWSIDKSSRVEGISWWKREQPSQEEFDEGIENLKKHNWEVDYVITHTCPEKYVNQLVKYVYRGADTTVERYLDFIQSEFYRLAGYNHWYFGHWHRDLELDYNTTAVYDRVIRIL